MKRILKSTTFKVIATSIFGIFLLVYYSLLGFMPMVKAEEDVLEQQDTMVDSTVLFDAYFEKSGKTYHRVKLDIDQTHNLKIRIKVKDKYYLDNIIVKLNDSNMELADFSTSYVKSVDKENNLIQLNSISSNNELEVEIPVKFKNERSSDIGYFSKITNIEFSAEKFKLDQIDSKTIEHTIKVKATFVQDIDYLLTNSFEQFYEKDLGEKEQILTQEINMKITKYTLPKINEKVYVQLPEIEKILPKVVNVVCNGVSLDTYEVYDGILEITNNRFVNEQTLDSRFNDLDELNGSDEFEYVYKITYSYTNLKIENKQIESSIAVKTKYLNIDDEILKTQEGTHNIVPTGNVISIKSSISEDIYNGYFKYESNRPIEILEQKKIGIEFLSEGEPLEILEDKTTYITNEQEEYDANVAIKKVIFKKSELETILGSDFNISGFNGEEQVLEVNKDTNVDEKGYIKIDIENLNAIRFVTSQVKEIGNFNIYLQKEVYKTKNSDVNKKIEQMKILSTIKQKEVVVTNTSLNVLKEATSKVNVDLNNKTWIVLDQTNNFELTLNLESSKPDTVLYENPNIEIKFPDEISELNITNIYVLNETFENTSNIKDEDGKKTLEIYLEGNQLEYLSNEDEAIVIKVLGNLKLDEKTVSKEDEIQIKTLNKKTNEEIYSSITIQKENPSELIISTKCENQDIEVVNANSGISQMLDVDSQGFTETIEYEIINNTQNNISDLSVIGTLGTDSRINSLTTTSSNMGAEVLGEISVDSENQSIEVYYTENEDATQDLEDDSNGWMQNIQNTANVKKYLVTANNVQTGETMNISYDLSIPENLGYSQTSSIVQQITYDDSVIYASPITYSTGNEYGIDMTIFPLVETKQIYPGDTITYSGVIENIGNIDITNLTGTISTQIGEFTRFKGEEIEPTQTINLNIETIKPLILDGVVDKNNSYYFDFKIKVDENNDVGTVLSPNIQISYTQGDRQYDEDKNISSLNIVKKPDIVAKLIDVIELKSNQLTDKKTSITPGASTLIYLDVENNTNKTYKNSQFILDTQNIEILNVRNINVQQEVTDEEPTFTILDFSENRINLDEVIPGRNVFEISIKLNPNYKDEKLVLDGRYSHEGSLVEVEQFEYSVVSRSDYQLKFYNTVDKDVLLKDNEQLEYTLEIISQINSQDSSGTSFTITDEIPKEFKIEKVTFENQVLYENDQTNVEYGAMPSILVSENNVINSRVILEKDIKYTFKILVSVRQTVRTQDVTVKNKVVVNTTSIESKQTDELENTIAKNVEMPTDEVTQIIEQISKGEGTNPDEEQDNQNQGNGTNNSQSSSNTQKAQRYSIYGTVFNDENKDGVFNNEKLVSDIKVKLINLTDNSEITKTTGKQGNYSFSNLQTGEYRIIATIPSGYTVSEIKEVANGNKFKISKSENGTTQAIVDVRVEEDIAIYLGLQEEKKFIPVIDKTITKLSITNSKGIFNYTYPNSKLAKIDLDGNNIENTQIVITYEIKVKNEGDKEGTVSRVIDVLPSDFRLQSELNKDWFSENGTLVNTSLQNTLIAPGEEKTLTLVATKTMNKNNTGVVINTAKIETGETQSTSDVKVILGLKTGDTNIIINIATLVIIFTLTYLIYSYRDINYLDKGGK